MSLPLLFFLALGAFIALVCLLGLLYRDGDAQLLDFSAERVSRRRAEADSRDFQSLLEAVNRQRRDEGLAPLNDEELQRAVAERELRER